MLTISVRNDEGLGLSVDVTEFPSCCGGLIVHNIRNTSTYEADRKYSSEVLPEETKLKVYEQLMQELETYARSRNRAKYIAMDAQHCKHSRWSFMKLAEVVDGWTIGPPIGNPQYSGRTIIQSFEYDVVYGNNEKFVKSDKYINY